MTNRRPAPQQLRMWSPSPGPVRLRPARGPRRARRGARRARWRRRRRPEPCACRPSPSPRRARCARPPIRHRPRITVPGVRSQWVWLRDFRAAGWVGAETSGWPWKRGRSHHGSSRTVCGVSAWVQCEWQRLCSVHAVGGPHGCGYCRVGSSVPTGLSADYGHILSSAFEHGARDVLRYTFRRGRALRSWRPSRAAAPVWPEFARCAP